MKKAMQLIAPFLVFFLTVSSWKVINQDWFLLFLTALLIAYIVFNKIPLENSFWMILAFWLYINLLSFFYFSEPLKSNAYTLMGSVMRIVIAYLLIKIAGINVFYRAEKVSFYVLLVSFPIFLLVELVPAAEAFFKHFDLGASSAQALEGGWNILVYAKNPWHKFRFTGYAWEPGGMALILVFSIILVTLRDGFKIDFRKITYVILLIFTFSTAGYLALAVLFGCYLLHYGVKSRYVILFIIVLPLLIPLINFVYHQDFMAKKIEWYLDNSEKNRGTGYNRIHQDRLSRFDYVFLAGELMAKWPVGYGISDNGRPKSLSNEGALGGANALMAILVTWGVVGFVFMLVMLRKFFKIQSEYYDVGYYNLFLIALLVVFFSNPVERSPLFYGIIFYPLIYGAEIKAAMSLRLSTDTGYDQ